MLLPVIGSADESPGLLVEPRASEWPALIRAFFGARSRDHAETKIQTRRELGLPTDRPIILTGHQAMVWHPGILAKYLATDRAAHATNSARAWLVVDQDSEDPWNVRYPVREASANHGGLAVASMRFPARTAAPDTPAASLPASAPLPAHDFPNAASPSVRDGLHRIHAALTRHRDQPSAARQLAAALADLLAPRKPDATVFASSLFRTALFQKLVGNMRDDPERCVRAYNAAVALHPNAKLRALAIDDVNVRYELPLWRLEFERERRRVFAEDLEQIPPDQLAPRALLTTGLMRAAACDLLVHGTGGGLYESVTEAWFRHWQPSLTLAPVAVVSATLRLPLLEAPPASAHDFRRAAWRSHHAPHDPAMLGDAAGGRHKMALVARIAEEKSQGRDPRSLYLAMHAALAQVRRDRRDRLAEIQSEAESAAARTRDMEIARDRTRPFPLYPPSMLESLADAINAAFTP